MHNHLLKMYEFYLKTVLLQVIYILLKFYITPIPYKIFFDAVSEWQRKSHYLDNEESVESKVYCSVKLCLPA